MDSDADAQEAHIAALFRDAASGAPPAAFDAAQVVATSRRITRRRRSAVAGAALAVLAVVGVGVVAGLGGPGEATVTASSGQAADQAGNSGAGAAGGAAGGADGAARAAAPEAAAAPDAAAGSPLGPAAPDVPAPAGSAAAGPVPPIGTPLGPGTRDCADRQDPALRALVEQALPEVVGAPEAATTLECRQAGERGVVLEVPGGLLTVAYLPHDPATGYAVGARTAPTASGGTVVVESRPDLAGDPAPFADRLDAVVAYLAPRL